VFVKVRVRGDVVKEEVITFRVYKVHRSYVSGSECSERERERESTLLRHITDTVLDRSLFQAARRVVRALLSVFFFFF
jgi:hypothetical protein